MSSLIYLLEQSIMEAKQEKPLAQTEEKKGGAIEMETQARTETTSGEEVKNQEVVKILARPDRSFSEKMDSVNKLFKQGKIPFEVFYESVSGLAEKRAEVERIKREISEKEGKVKAAAAEIKDMENQELLIRQMLNQGTLRSLREVVNRAVSEAPNLEDAEALLIAGIAEVVIQPAAQPKAYVEGPRKEREKLAAQSDQRIQELKQEIRRDAEFKRLENLNQKAVEQIPALAKSVEDVDKPEALAILDDYFLTGKEKLIELGLTEPEIVFIRRRAVSLLKGWLGAWKEVLSPEDKNELEERIRRLPGEVLRRTLAEVLQ